MEQTLLNALTVNIFLTAKKQKRANENSRDHPDLVLCGLLHGWLNGGPYVGGDAPG